MAGQVRALLSCHCPTHVQPLSRHPLLVLWVGLPAPPAPQLFSTLQPPWSFWLVIVAYLPSLHLWSKNSDHVILILWCWSGFALWLDTGQFLWMFPACLEWGMFSSLGVQSSVLWWFQIILNSITYISWGHISCCSQSRMFWRIFFFNYHHVRVLFTP